MNINNAFRQAIGDASQINTILRQVIFGELNPNVAIGDFLESWMQHLAVDNARGTAICQSILQLGRDYPFAQERLARLIVAISLLRFEEWSEAKRSFMRTWQRTADQLSEQQHSDMRHPHATHDQDDIQTYGSLHQFLAQILETEVTLSFTHGLMPNRRLPGPAHALYAISVALEDHLEAHDWIEFDVFAAAQYFILAGRAIILYCLYQ